MNLKILATTVAVMSVAPIAAQAVELDYVGARVSTLGLGAEVGVEVNPLITVRGIINKFDYSYDDTLDGVKYEGDLKLGSVGAQVDLKVFPGFYVTGGYYANDNKLDLRGTPTGNTEIGDTTFTPSQIGTITQNTKFSKGVPYLGLGVRQGIGPVELNLEAGAFMQGAAKVSLASNGSLASDPTFMSELAKEQSRLEDELDDFKVYPALNVGLRMKF
ncbi:hypothetical protein [Asticcacaulis machinosus]|uniref:Outer membrane protein beta-barrel domain-containing protein n=1 Tax=Asticcacaulis machinosus TaxID=2984211 RepID=A0ABT5HGN1_9CAUL|nr:hypothetical protein [Asticcacaulis machinosus]MDC7675295.1 hypothetical protein [Asticcacaulis machinosus]